MLNNLKSSNIYNKKEKEKMGQIKYLVIVNKKFPKCD